MDIKPLVSRPDVSGATVNTPTKSSAPAHANVAHGNVDAPAATAQLSGISLIMGLIHAYESQHPDYAKAFLQSVADKLLADAQHAGTFAPSLQAWGSAFQRAADTGDSSNLWPSAPLVAHFGVQAYQTASQPANEAPAIDAVARGSLPPLASGATANELETITGQLLGSVFRHAAPPPAHDVSRENFAAYDALFAGQAYAHRLSVRLHYQRRRRRHQRHLRRRRRYRRAEAAPAR